jgi:hypothetical protein
MVREHRDEMLSDDAGGAEDADVEPGCHYQTPSP